MRRDHIGLVFEALADPTRRTVVRLMSESGPLSCSQLAAQLPVTRQAIAKHLQALSDAGLVASQRRGREKLYRLTPRPMTDAMGWMAQVGAEWDDRLDALRTYLKRR